ncbi:Uncharacterized protein Fot_54387 [Forsythia ovata]|uniref:Uncharacterized protein n=1 Tax=Forsythia ovata TaxID=205694 RepID=A0ABD1P6Z4_9LAMI
MKTNVSLIHYICRLFEIVVHWKGSRLVDIRLRVRGSWHGGKCGLHRVTGNFPAIAAMSLLTSYNCDQLIIILLTSELKMAIEKFTCPGAFGTLFVISFGCIGVVHRLDVLGLVCMEIIQDELKNGNNLKFEVVNFVRMVSSACSEKTCRLAKSSFKPGLKSKLG